MMNYQPHDQREAKALDSLVPYVRDRVVRVLTRMKVNGHDPYCLWGRRSIMQQLGAIRRGASLTKHSKHLVGKAVDIVDQSDLKAGGSGWRASESFKRDLIAAYAVEGLYSGSAWKRYGAWGDWAHGEWRGGKTC